MKTLALVDIMVQFIDYGNFERVTSDQIFTSSFESYAPFAFEVQIDGLDLAQLDDPNGFFNFLQHFLNTELSATIVEKCYPTLKVDLKLTGSGDDLIKVNFDLVVCNMFFFILFLLLEFFVLNWMVK